ncbi:MAG: arylamine N-acetyltransferase [Phycisphaerae bacterium]|nr:arylamine N-acetyltransferase [Phycisphaerae bacterium]
MTLEAHLPNDIAADALAHLGLAAGPPTVERLTALVAAYPRRVPWETASRIVYGPVDGRTPFRSPTRFWRDAIDLGTGGTCFESNRAVAALLATLGYDVTLTINDMDEHAACHTAMIARIDGERWLADLGLPVHAVLRLDPDAETTAESPFHDYAARPAGPRRFDIMRTHHPRPRCFTLHDDPVALPDYDEATRADYGPGGLFLDQLIITKVIDGRSWRYRGDEQPQTLEWFARENSGVRCVPADPVPTLGRHFAMDGDLLERAWRHLDPSTPDSDGF